MNPATAVIAVSALRRRWQRRWQRRKAAGEQGFTLIELVISTTILGFVGAALITVFMVSIRSSDRAAVVLPGPRASNSLAQYLTSDISSATPVDPKNWLSSDPAMDTGCSDTPDGTVNILRIDTRDPFAPETTYVASYRYEAPTGPARTGKIWRVFCRSGERPTTQAVIAGDVDPVDEPVAVISDARDSAALEVSIRSKDRVYRLVLRATIRTQVAVPEREPGVTTTRPPRIGCGYTDGAVGEAVKTGTAPGPLTGPVPITVITNEAAGGQCSALVATITGNAAECLLERKPGTDRWSGSCFGPAGGTTWPRTPTTWPVAVMDRVDGSDPGADVPVPGGPSLAMTVRTPVVISGTVFEDVNYGGGAGRALAPALANGASRRPGARVELYAVTGASATFERAVVTDAAGAYRFTDPTCTRCAVRVVGATVTSGRPGATAALRGVPTFMTAAATGTVVARTDMVGGTNPAGIDAAAASDGASFDTATGRFSAGPTGTAQAFTTIDESLADAAGVDFGYSFSTVVNTRDTGDGSLRQWLANASALGSTGLALQGQTPGRDVSIFMIPGGSAVPGIRSGVASGLTGGRALIEPAGTLVWGTGTNAADTVLDATTQTRNVGNTNAGSVPGGPVGTGADGRVGTGDETALAAFERPEVELRYPAGGIGISVSDATRAVVRGVAINGTSMTALVSGTGGTAPRVEDLFIGTDANGTAAGSLAPSGATALVALSDQSYSPGDVAIQRSHATASSPPANMPVLLVSGSPNAVVTRNDVTVAGPNGAGIAVNSSTATASFNRVTARGTGAALGAWPGSAGRSTSGVQFLDNTVTNSARTAAILAGAGTSGHTVARNVVLANANGIVVAASSGSTPSATGVAIRMNSVSGTVNPGIDLIGVAAANDGVTNATQPNLGIDTPVLTSATLGGASLTLTGYVGSAADQRAFAGSRVEVFVSSGHASGSGDGQTYLGSLAADPTGNIAGSVPVPGSVTIVAGTTRITATASDAAGNTSEFGPDITAGSGRTVSGTVFEDRNYGGGAGRPRAAAPGWAPATNADNRPTVELYDASGAFVSSTRTAADGTYRLSGLVAGRYQVRMVTTSAASTRAGWVAAVLPVLTFRTDASTGAAIGVTDRVGGQMPSIPDAAPNGTRQNLSALMTRESTAQAVTPVDLARGDVTDADFGVAFDVVTNTADIGPGSIRQAMFNANVLGEDGALAQTGRTPGVETIVFMLSNGTAAPGLNPANTVFASGAATFTPSSSLPRITTRMTIDAQSQPGWTDGPLVQLDGANLAAVSAGSGFSIAADSVVVRGLSLTGWKQTAGADSTAVRVEATARGTALEGNWIGITPRGEAAGNGIGVIVEGSTTTIGGGSEPTRRNVVSGNTADGIAVSGSGTVISGNVIGLDPTGRAKVPNGAAGSATGGVRITAGSATVIGGTNPAERNIISGNGGAGIWADSGTATAIRGNWIGTDGSGTAALGNGRWGIVLQAATGTVVGGVDAGNVISGNSAGQASAIYVAASGTVIQGNRIGLAATGATSVPNGGGLGSVWVRGASNVTVGGTRPGEGNTIATNLDAGVWISGAGTGNSVLGNAIFANSGLGIDLHDGTGPDTAPDGATRNDGARSPGRANQLMDAPVFTATTMAGSTLTMEGYIGTAAGQSTFGGSRVEVFAADGDASGFGEGQTYLGFVTADSDGNFAASITIPPGASLIPGGTRITATATDRNGNTSEFGPSAVIGSGRLGLAMWVDASDLDGDADPSDEPALNSAVDTMTDKSGNNRHFASATGAQPTLIASPGFARNVLRFTPSQWMRQSANFPAPSTVIYVARSRTSASNRILQAASNNWLLGWWGGSEGVAYYEGWVKQGGANTQKARVMSATMRGPGLSSDLHVDGRLVASNTGGTTGPNGLGINGGGAYSGESTDAELAEILVYTKALTATERASVEMSLAAKWGIALPLQLTATTPTTQAGAAGQPVATPPAVRLTDISGAPVAGATVTFAIASGGGSVGGARSAAVVTDTAGNATSPRWVLGSLTSFAGLTASAVNADPVSFSATNGTCPAYGVCTNLAMWVDASDTDADGDASNEPAIDASVLQLLDRSGNGRHFASAPGGQPTLVSSASFSKPVLRFTPSQWMRQSANFPAPSTVIYVGRARTASSNRILQAASNNWLLGWWAGWENVAYYEGWVKQGTDRASLSPYVMSATMRGPGLPSDVHANGRLIASNTGGTTGPNGLGINGGGAYPGESTDAEVAEILVYTQALSSVERLAVERSLATKWGIARTPEMNAVTPMAQSGTPGQPAPIGPRVEVINGWSGPANGVAVTFTVEGGGTVGGGASSTVLTDASGTATAPAWVLGSGQCSYRLRATTPITATSVVFAATTGACTAYGVASPAMWVDASDIDADGSAANEPAPGATVARAVDKSGNLRDFTSAPGAEPTLVSSSGFARNVLRFAPNQWMRQTDNVAAPSTVIYVARSRTAANNRILQSVANNWLLGWWSGWEGVAHFDGWVQQGVAGSNTQRARIMSAINRGPGQNSDFFTEGVLRASNANGVSGPNGLAINGGGAFPGESTDAEVAEIVVFARALTPTERATVEQALATKWGVETAAPVQGGLIASFDANRRSSMFQASDGTGPVTATGQQVCRWSDVSGTANHAVQSTAARCARYGTDATGGFVDFAANGSMAFSPTLSPDATVLVVAQSTTPTWNTWGWLASARGPNGFILHPWPGGTSWGPYVVNSSGTYTGVGNEGSVATLQRPTLYELTISGSNPVTGVWGRNGATTAYSAPGVVRTAGPVLVQLGADTCCGSRLGNGRYREVLIYDRALSATELTAVEAYLRGKWGTG